MTNIMPPGPLAYEGVVAVPGIVRHSQAPTTANNQFDVPTIWVDPEAPSAYVLVAKPGGVANWLQISTSTSNLNQLQGNTGGPINPIAGIMNVVGDGSVITTAGVSGFGTIRVLLSGIVPVPHGGSGAATLTGVLIGNGTSAFTGNPVTQNFALIGSSGNGIGSVDPGSTAGVPFVSNGSGAPSFTTATVPGGGTGLTSTTAYAVICGGTTTTAALQSIASVGTSGQVLTSNGAGALPTFQAASSGKITSISRQVFATSGSYTPTSGMLQCDIEVVGGGGGGGGSAAVSGNQVSNGAGGGGGGYARGLFSAATIGAVQSVAIGAGGAGGVGSGAAGNTGGTTALGILISATGGVGGNGDGAGDSTGRQIGGSGGVGTGGDYQTMGQPGFYGFGTNLFALSGAGGSSFFGGGGIGGGKGNAGNSYGGGGSGAASENGDPAHTGGTGFSGVVIITEYLSV